MHDLKIIKKRVVLSRLARSLMITLACVPIGLLIGTVPGNCSPYDVEVTPESLTPEPIYSPFVNRDYPDQVLFGDSHFHTNLSFDAGLIGTRLTVHEGYRFARGEKVISNTGQPVQLIRPLDFLVVTDHAEFIGLAPMIHNSDPLLLADSWGRCI